MWDAHYASLRARPTPQPLGIEGMINLNTVLKAAFLCAISSAAYNLYLSTHMFMQQLSVPGNELGRWEAFMYASEITRGFWPRMLRAWSQSFLMAFIPCIVLLTWIKPQTPNKVPKSALRAGPR